MSGDEGQPTSSDLTDLVQEALSQPVKRKGKPGKGPTKPGPSEDEDGYWDGIKKGD